MSEIKSEGHCLFCNRLFSKQGINRHLVMHLNKKVKENKGGKSYLLKIESNPKWGSGPYFLSLWVDGRIIMEDIDDFLRAIWLECCGHMSSFTDPAKKRRGNIWDLFEPARLLTEGKKKTFEQLMEDGSNEIPMSRKAHAVLRKGMKIDYEYDFGSTTSLQITVVEEFPVQSDQPIVLLSRNEPLQIICESCGKEPAVKICSVCIDYEESAFCKKCAKQHGKTCSDFADHASMPVVNSPRMGVCGYDGGSIDIQRDGAYSKK